MSPEQAAMLRKADDSLRGARLLVADGLNGFAASRAYYAMFYAAEALLEAHDMSFSKLRRDRRFRPTLCVDRTTPP